MTRSDVVRAIAAGLIAARDPLNEADSAAGDGDLGITASSIGDVLNALAPELDALEPAAALRKAGLEIGAKAPSTFGTLVSLGLVGASRNVGDLAGVPAPTAVARIVRAIYEAIVARGRAE